MEFIEFTGKTVEDAITAACEHFVITSDKLDYEILENGSAGFLGIGAKPAKIKACVKSNKKKEDSVKPEKVEKSVKVEKTVNENKAPKQEKVEAPAPAKVEEKVKTVVNIDEKQLKESAEKFLKDVFTSMNLEVNIKTEYFAKDMELDVELSGPEMGVLIGKRGQTLDSLQYLTSLVVNKGTSSYIRVKVDTEDYRRRRKDTLENLAKNLSYKVKRTRKPVSLEPMNPYERRIIHSALQGDKYVTTHSEGEEPFRRVVITPKRER